MPGHGHGGKASKKGKGRKVAWGLVPTESITNPLFFSHPSAPVTHGQSKTWKSDETKSKEQFDRYHNIMKNFFGKSRTRALIPWNFSDWVDHQSWYRKIEKAKLEMKLAMMERRKRQIPGFEKQSDGQPKSDILPGKDMSSAPHPEHTSTALAPAFGPGGKSFNDNLSAVLSRPTVFSTWWTPTPDHPKAPWPELSELDHEGRQRAESKYGPLGRYLPLPRHPGNETVHWKARQQIMPYYGLDMSGPMAYDAPPPFVVSEQNWYMNNDANFQALGNFYLGQVLGEKLSEECDKGNWWDDMGDRD